jgi:hypothetical protein
MSGGWTRRIRAIWPLCGDPPLRTVWCLSKEGRLSRLVGSAHFSPCRFGRSVERLVREASVVLFEGPLDEAGLARAALAGLDPQGASLLDRLTPETVAILRRLLAPLPAAAPSQTSLGRLLSPAEDLPGLRIRGLRPWLAFFTIWAGYLRALGWRSSLDLEAYRNALRLGRKVVFLETIGEQTAALEAIPEERFVAFLDAAAEWPRYAEQYRQRYLAGDITGLVAGAAAFPTRCEAIVGRRDPVLFERMLPWMGEGRCAAFVGGIHIPGIGARFADAGWEVRPEAVQGPGTAG